MNVAPKQLTVSLNFKGPSCVHDLYTLSLLHITVWCQEWIHVIVCNQGRFKVKGCQSANRVAPELSGRVFTQSAKGPGFELRWSHNFSPDTNMIYIIFYCSFHSQAQILFYNSGVLYMVFFSAQVGRVSGLWWKNTFD